MHPSEISPLNPKHTMNFAQIIANIEARACFEATLDDGLFHIKIEDWKPYLCTALHAGTDMGKLGEFCALTEKQRWPHLTPHVDQFISALPITLTALDSRFVLDLNRSLDLCLPETFNGQNLWVKPMNRQDKKYIQGRYKKFYKVLSTLCLALIEDFGSICVYDFYSYNYQDLNRHSPLFNIGTENVHAQYLPAVVRWEKELAHTEFSHMETVVLRNDVYFGRGWMARFLFELSENILVLPTEIKKFYCDEKTGAIYPLMVQQLQEQIKQAIVHHSSWFVSHFGHPSEYSTPIDSLQMLGSDLQKEVVQIDKRFYDLTRRFELLSLLNPQNLESEKNKFFKSQFRLEPQFRYKHFSIDPLQFKRALYQLPIEHIRDPHTRQVYLEMVDSFSDRVDMMTAIGTPQFLMQSLRHYGQPTATDIENAKFILHCTQPSIQSAQENTSELISAEMSIPFFEKGFELYGFDYRIEINANAVAKAAMVGSKNLLKIKKNAAFTPLQIQALIHHEIGVHMVTSVNSRLQPLKILQNGLPRSTETQEGLAILCEYLSGNLSFERLQELAWRTLATQHLVDGQSFTQTFLTMIEKHGMNPDNAFYLVARVYRGGGFTKDHVYLKGFTRLLNMHKSGVSLESLYMGKVSTPYLGWVNEMKERKIFSPPKFSPLALMPEHQKSNMVGVDFVVERLRV